MKVKLFRSTWAPWVQAHAQFHGVSEKILLELGLDPEAAKTIAENYSVEVDKRVEEPVMLVYTTQPHDNAANTAYEIVMIADEERVKKALEKLAKMLEEDMDEEEIVEELINDFDPQSVCQQHDEFTTVIVSGPCSVNYTIP